MSRILAVGDIHTKLWIIDEVRKIADNYDRVVFVGDYADDWGKQPRDTIQTWLELRSLSHSNPNVKLVQGNHDFAYTRKVGTSSGGYSVGTQFILDVPENRGLKDWLTNIPLSLEIDGVTYSHAGFVEDYHGGTHPDTLWNDISPLWVRPDYGYTYQQRPQVFGHTPSQTCWEVDDNIWCIDTFSTYPDGTPFGDNTVLEVIDGKTFKTIKLEKQNARNNNPTSGIS
jgi:diadenosine tetraphosphatase ApaH/serine/threonine PP2A family protein phosphatase